MLETIFMTISYNIKFGTGEMIMNMISVELLELIIQAKVVYMKHGFNITHMIMDHQF